MKVLQIIGLGAKKFGGLERYMLELAHQLQQKEGQLLIVFETEPVAQIYLDELSKTNALWFVIPYSKSKIRFMREITKLINLHKPDVVHTNFSKNIFISLLIAHFKHVKAVFHTEHCMPVINGVKPCIIYKFISVFCDKIFGVSEAIATTLKKDAKVKNVECLYLGVNDFSFDKVECRIKYNLPLDKIIISNIAYHNPIKGVDILLKAIDRLKELGCQNFLVCQIGGGQTGIDTDYLHSCAKELKIDNLIKWMGIQNNVPEILSASDIYLQPSRSEGISLSIMEASFAKLPTVATKVGGIPEAVHNEKTGILVPSEDVNALATALQRLIISCDLRKKMGGLARENALSQFFITVQVTKLLKEYSETLNKYEQ